MDTERNPSFSLYYYYYYVHQFFKIIDVSQNKLTDEVHNI
jgi:hypothetical protein